jgi:hypothetical protein
MLIHLHTGICKWMWQCNEGKPQYNSQTSLQDLQNRHSMKLSESMYYNAFYKRSIRCSVNIPLFKTLKTKIRNLFKVTYLLFDFLYAWTCSLDSVWSQYCYRQLMTMWLALQWRLTSSILCCFFVRLFYYDASCFLRTLTLPSPLTAWQIKS